jgi:hypothetical protein
MFKGMSWRARKLLLELICKEMQTPLERYPPLTHQFLTSTLRPGGTARVPVLLKGIIQIEILLARNLFNLSMGTTPQAPSTIVQAAGLCAQAFAHALSVELTDHQSSSELDDEVGRFKIWAGSLGVFAADTASADYRFRDEQALKDVLIGMLTRLEENLQQLHQTPPLQVVPEERPEYLKEESSAESLESLAPSNASSSSLDLISDSDSDKHSRENFVYPRSKTNCFSEITDIINRLYRLSAAIRKPVSTGENERVATFKEKTKETLNLGDIESFDRFQIQRLCPSTTTILVDRLAEMVTLRRMKLLYRQRHQQKLNQGTEDWFNLNPTENHESQFAPESQDEPSKDKREVEQDIQKKVQKNVAFAFSATKASSVNRQIIPVYEKSVAPSGVTKSAIARRENLDVPPPPKLKHGQEAKCPYCSKFLKKEELGTVRWTSVSPPFPQLKA